MNAEPPQAGSEEEWQRSRQLRNAAAKLDVYRQERLDYTEPAEPPVSDDHPKLPRFRGRFAAFWRAVCHWVISR